MRCGFSLMSGSERCRERATWRAEYEVKMGGMVDSVICLYCSMHDLHIRMHLNKMGFRRIISRKRIRKE